MDVLIPMRTPHQHNVIRVVLAYFTDNLSGILLHAGPCILYRLIIYFVDDMRITTVLLCHLTKELLGLTGVHVVRMPVDDDINVLFDSRLDDGCQARYGPRGILNVAGLRVFFWLHTHCGTYYRTIPVALQRLHHLFVIETRPPVVPTKTHATQRHRITSLVTQLGTLYLQLSILLDRINSVHIACTHAQ